MNSPRCGGDSCPAAQHSLSDSLNLVSTIVRHRRRSEMPAEQRYARPLSYRRGQLVRSIDEPIRLGTMLWVLTDPHRGHEFAYNRWYERDHYYAGCMIGAYTLAGQPVGGHGASQGRRAADGRARRCRSIGATGRMPASTSCSTATTTSGMRGRHRRCTSCTREDRGFTPARTTTLASIGSTGAAIAIPIPCHSSWRSIIAMPGWSPVPRRRRCRAGRRVVRRPSRRVARRIPRWPR